MRPWKKRYFGTLYRWPTGKSWEYWLTFVGWVFLIVPFVLTL